MNSELHLLALDLRASRRALADNPQYHPAVAVHLAERKHATERRATLKVVTQ